VTANNNMGAAELLRKYLERPAGSDLLGEMVKMAAELLMDADVDLICNAGYNERSDDRQDSHNGHRARRWDTRAGTISSQSANEVLTGVLANEGAGLSAHGVLERAQLRAEDFDILAAEYQTLARAAQQQRWDELLGHSALDPERLAQVRQRPAYGPLLAALRGAEAHGLEVEQTLPGLVATRPLKDAEDPAAVLRDRVDRCAQAAGSSRRAGRNLIAGLIPRAVDVTDPEMARGLEERVEAMQLRARALAEQAVERNQIWVRRLGIAPSDPRARERWIEAVTTVVAYRDRWNIDDYRLPIGPNVPARSIDAVNQRDLARAALERGSRLSFAAETSSELEAVDVGFIATGGPSL
jgi:hypothetical protein